MEKVHPVDVTVAAVIERGDRFLLVEEIVGGRDVFNQPAGHIEPGESPREAVVRETLEESGYRFRPTELLGIYMWQHPETARRFLRIAFTGSAIDPKGSPRLDEGILGVHWLTYRELLQQEPRVRSPMVMQCIDDYISGKSYPLDAITQLMSGFEEAWIPASVAG